MARGDLNSSQAGRQTRGDALTDRQVEAMILRVLTTKLGLSERNVQQLQELVGERGDLGRPRAAVRRADLAALGRLPAFSSEAAAGTPTQAEFNALRAEVQALYEAFSIVLRALRQT